MLLFFFQNGEVGLDTIILLMVMFAWWDCLASSINCKYIREIESISMWFECIWYSSLVCVMLNFLLDWEVNVSCLHRFTHTLTHVCVHVCVHLAVWCVYTCVCILPCGVCTRVYACRVVCVQSVCASCRVVCLLLF